MAESDLVAVGGDVARPEQMSIAEGFVESLYATRLTRFGRRWPSCARVLRFIVLEIVVFAQGAPSPKGKRGPTWGGCAGCPPARHRDQMRVVLELCAMSLTST